MSDDSVIYNDLLTGLSDTNTETVIETKPEVPIQEVQIEPQLFTIDKFIQDLTTNSANFNKTVHNNSIHMNAYDVASNCIREIIFKILNYPIKDYKAVWLPILLRAELGKAVHNFIQSNSTVFTEQERSMKVPSIRVSGRLDCLINDNILCEIKSCTYDDYHKILTKRQPRMADFMQTLLYKYLLENYLSEIKSQPRKTLRSDPPALDKYKIQYIQFICRS